MEATENPGGAAPGVVIHLDEGEPAKHEAVLRNIANLLDELGPGTAAELVVHGPGLDAVLDGAPHAAAVRDLLGKGVAVAACGNTMRQRSVPASRLIPGVRVVPAGIAELVRRQREGWSYVRP
jgi:intracellular sulfur oxidation DsrE/DsrF family protein